MEEGLGRKVKGTETRVEETMTIKEDDDLGPQAAGQNP